MNRIKFTAIIIFILSFFSFCNNLEQDELIIKDMLSKLNYHFPQGDSVAVVVLPSHGCQSCLNATSKYIDAHYQNNKLLCIIGGLSPKDIKLRFMNPVLESDNIVKETKGYIYSNHINNPTAFYFVKGQLISKTTINSLDKKVFFTELTKFIK